MLKHEIVAELFPDIHFAFRQVVVKMVRDNRWNT